MITNNWYEQHFLDMGDFIVYIRVSNKYIQYEDRLIVEYSFN